MSNMLANRAVLAVSAVSQWSGFKVDRAVTNKAIADHDAEHTAGRFNKSLVARSSLSAITAGVTEARTVHYALTSPWVDNGPRVLSIDNLDEWRTKMEGFRNAFFVNRDIFLGAWSEHIDAARRQLGGMFNPSDYPAAETLRNRFRWSLNTMALPDVADIRTDLSAEQIALLKADMERQYQDIARNVQTDAFERVRKIVGHLAEKLQAYAPNDGTGAAGIFRDSTVSNVVELIDALPGLNVARDPAIDAMITSMRDLVRYDAASLRENTDIRHSVRDKAISIVQTVDDFLG